MEKKAINKSIRIAAPKEKVWKILTDKHKTDVWYTAFGENIQAEINWELGGRAVFKDKNGDGIAGKIAANNPPHLLSIEYMGVVTKNVEDYESDYAKSVKGFCETYTLIEEGEFTQLDVHCDTGEEYFEYMSASWDKAVELIKELAEK